MKYSQNCLSTFEDPYPLILQKWIIFCFILDPRMFIQITKYVAWNISRFMAWPIIGWKAVFIFWNVRAIKWSYSNKLNHLNNCFILLVVKTSYFCLDIKPHGIFFLNMIKYRSVSFLWTNVTKTILAPACLHSNYISQLSLLTLAGATQCTVISCTELCCSVLHNTVHTVPYATFYHFQFLSRAST